MRAFPYVLVLCSVFSGPIAAAQEAAYVPPDFLSSTPPLPADIDQAGAWRLDLAETLRIAVRQNLGVSLERQTLKVSTLSITVARGLFEPTLELSYAHGSSRTPPSTSQEGMAGEIFEATDDRWQLSLGQRLATGMQLSVDFGTTRSSSTLGTAVAPLNYRTTLSLGVTQPLLRGFSTDLDLPRYTVLQARLGSEREKQQLAIVVADLVERAEAAYWDVVRALYRYSLGRLSLERAEAQLTLARRQIESGVLPPSDVISAESTLAQRRLQLVQAEEAIGAAWDSLRGILHLPRDQWSRAILPIDTPKFVPSAVGLDDAMKLATANRPELAQIDLDVRQATLALRKAENDKLPQIDLGLVGTIVGQDDRYAPALGQLGEVEARGWSVFLNLTWTPLRRATGAAAEISQTQLDMTTTRREQLVQTIWLAVRQAQRDLQSAARQVAAAAKFRELAEKSLDVEQRKFLNGTSSNFLIAQRQEELAAAQFSELDAVVAHTKASTALARATGRLLDERHIDLAVK